MPTSKHKHTTSNLLPVMEHFYSIQGEGFNTGKAAFFIRLGGCNVGCVWCDVKESWNANAHPKISVSELISEAKKIISKNIIVTGGEPCMYDLTILCNELKKNFGEFCLRHIPYDSESAGIFFFSHVPSGRSFH